VVYRRPQAREKGTEHDDYHPSFQAVAFLMEETGECGEQERSLLMPCTAASTMACAKSSARIVWACASAPSDAGATSVAVPSPNLDNWSLGANTPQFANNHGWVELNIQASVAISQKINFTLHCQ
jgi:hypothetical protein